MSSAKSENSKDLRQVAKYIEKLRKDHKNKLIPEAVYDQLRETGIYDMVVNYKQTVKISKIQFDANLLCDWIKAHKKLPLPSSADPFEADLGEWYQAKIQGKKNMLAKVKKNDIYFDFMCDHVAEQEGFKGLFDEGFKL